MAHLTLNGITIPVAAGESSRLEPELIGEEGRAFSGADLMNVRGYKEGWKATLTPQTAAAAAALRGLVRGEGFSWSFDTDLYADLKGLGPSLSTGCAVGGGGKYSSMVQINPTNTLRYAITGSATKWTLSYWKLSLDFDGPVWEHFIVLGDGTKYKSGVATTDDTWVSYDGTTLRLRSAADVYPAWQASHAYAIGALIHGGTLNSIYRATNPGTSDSGTPDFDTAPALEDTVSDASITWQNVDDGYGQFDDARFLPYLVPASWAPQIYAEANARAMTPLPRLRLAGDVAADLVNGYATVTGKLGDAKLIRGRLDGSTVTNAQPLDVTLREA